MVTLYSAEILRWAKSPQTFDESIEYTGQIRVSNPICGDRIDWYVFVEEQQIDQVVHQTKGCILCKASASWLSAQIGQQSIASAQEVIQQFQSELESVLRGEMASAEVRMFEPLQQARGRTECVLLPWRGLEQLLGTIQSNH